MCLPLLFKLLYGKKGLFVVVWSYSAYKPLASLEDAITNVVERQKAEKPGN
jgi:hypothetical protein